MLIKTGVGERNFMGGYSSFRLAVFVLLGIVPLLAQNASVVGTVKDAQEAVVPSATVTLTNLQTGIAQVTKTDTSGNYEFPQTRPGNYSIKVEHAGFATYVQSPFVLEVEQRGRADVSLQLGQTSTIITVEAQSSAIQTESSSLGSVVSSTKISQLPLNGRFFLDLAMIQVGTVAPSTNNRTFLAVPSGIGISGINASGTR
jgi:hypothetical protein